MLLTKSITDSVNAAGDPKAARGTPNFVGRAYQGKLGKVFLTYHLYSSGDLEVRCHNRANTYTKTIKISTPLSLGLDGSLQKVSIRRVVGLTQRFDKATTTPYGTENSTGKRKLYTRVVLSGSIITGLNFSGGHIGAYPRLDRYDTPTDRVRSGDSSLKAPLEHWSPYSWNSRNGLFPPSRLSNGKYMIDFVQGPTKPRLSTEPGKYRTGYQSENVRINMGSRSREKDVRGVGKGR